jgi:hypothetical protein
MKIGSILATIVVTAASTPAQGQLVSQRADGLARVCEYAPKPGRSDAVTHRVGLGDPCPALAPLVDTGRPPDSAGLTSDVVVDDRRVCIYSQGMERWTVDLPVTQHCPLSAGMVAKNGPAPLGSN